MGVAGEIVPLSDEYTQAGGIPALLSPWQSHFCFLFSCPGCSIGHQRNRSATGADDADVSPGGALFVAIQQAGGGVEGEHARCHDEGTAAAAATAATVATPPPPARQPSRRQPPSAPQRPPRKPRLPRRPAPRTPQRQRSRRRRLLGRVVQHCEGGDDPGWHQRDELVAAVHVECADSAGPHRTAAHDHRDDHKTTSSVSSTTPAFTATTLPPLTQPVKAATTGEGTIQYPSLSGFVYLDTNSNGVRIRENGPLAAR